MGRFSSRSGRVAGGTNHVESFQQQDGRSSDAGRCGESGVGIVGPGRSHPFKVRGHHFGRHARAERKLLDGPPSDTGLHLVVVSALRVFGNAGGVFVSYERILNGIRRQAQGGRAHDPLLTAARRAKHDVASLFDEFTDLLNDFADLFHELADLPNEFTDLFDKLESLSDKFTNLFNKLESLSDEFTNLFNALASLFHELASPSHEFTGLFNKLTVLSHDEHAPPWHVVLNAEDLPRVRILASRAHSHSWARSQRVSLRALDTPVPPLIRLLVAMGA